MHVPMINSRASDMLMSDAMKESRRNKADNQDNYQRAQRLQRTYPYLANVGTKFLMWALLRLGLTKVEEAAALNLTSFTFKQKIQQLNA